MTPGAMLRGTTDPVVTCAREPTSGDRLAHPVNEKTKLAPQGSGESLEEGTDNGATTSLPTVTCHKQNSLEDSLSYAGLSKRLKTVQS